MPNTNTSKACPPLSQYQQLASGQLSDFEKESLLSHLEGCDACALKLKSVPEPDTLIGMMRQADTVGEETARKAVAGLIERLSKLRPEQVSPDAKPQVTAAYASEANDTIDQPPVEGALRARYDFLAPPQAPDELGRLGPYRVLEVLGTGGMGVVFRAEDPQLARQVALKAMLPGFVASDTARQRFLREARAAAAIKHDHIVTIHQVGEDRGVLFLAMELLDGEPLDARLQREGKLPVADVLRIGRQIALALAAAHKRGMIHRDIKPANIFLEAETNRVKILDFGLARAAGDQAQLTQKGAIVGTPAYMAPEQGKGKDVDHRCDLFSLGCVLYRMATGAAPFSGTDVVSTLLSVATETPRSPQVLEPRLPRALSELIVRLLAKDAATRPTSAQVVIEKLDHIAHEMVQPAKAKPRKRWPAIAAAAGFLALLAAGIVFYMQTADGVVRIEIDDPEIKLAIEGHTATITNADKQPITLKPGKHGLTITRGDFVFNTASFELPRRGRTALKITWLPGQKLVVTQDGTVIGEQAAPLAKTFKNSLGMEFVLVPKGKSWLGGGGGNPGEKEVEITNDFYLGKYEVTQEEWESVMWNNPSLFKAVPGVGKVDQKRFPVEHVSWDSAQVFIARLNKQMQEAGWVYRLPKQAEWEYACRGGPGDKIDSAFDFYLEKPTNLLLAAQANFEHGEGLKRTCKVGSYPPNRLGLYDMHGNVNEWCDDKAADRADLRVLRGGGWSADAGHCRATSVHALPPGTWVGPYLGLRLARAPVGKAIVKLVAEEKKPPVEIQPPKEFKNSLGMEFVLVPKGKSWLGGGGGNPGTQEVEITHDFYLGVYEVTQAEWEKVLGTNPSAFKAVPGVAEEDQKRFPVEMVSWEDAQLFLKELNRRDKETGWVYRLPREAEWEYACRGGPTNDKSESAFDFYFEKAANQLLRDQANFEHGNGLKRTRKVGAYKPNRLGLYDMHGNVWEMCDDERTIAGTSVRTVRGGSWPDGPCPAGARHVTVLLSHRSNDRGLRVARVPVGKEIAVVQVPAVKATIPPDVIAYLSDLKEFDWKGTSLFGKNGRVSIPEAKKSLDFASGVYKVYDKPNSVRHTTFDWHHDYSQAMREALYGWLAKHLKGEGDGSPIPAPPMKTEDSESLRCFPGNTRPADWMTIPKFAAAEGRRLLAARKLPDDDAVWRATSANTRQTLSEKVLGGYPSAAPFLIDAVGGNGKPQQVTIRPEPGITLTASRRLGAMDKPSPLAIVLDFDGADKADQSPIANALQKDGWSGPDPGLARNRHIRLAERQDRWGARS